tara:strand:+ start:85 stop:582 length:498 start_codon:yes stop_codon:yes gene_type:complete
MPKMIDITNEKYGRLLVKSRATPVYNGKRFIHRWLCVCDCRTEIIAGQNHLRAGRTKSCGCYKIDSIKYRMTTHGDTGTRLHVIWMGMKNRINNPKPYQKTYKSISYCNRWESYEKFKEDMYKAYLKHVKIHGERNTTIDRINNVKGYFKRNCRWATYSVQIRNR